MKISIIVLAVLTSSCATVERERALTVAKSGETATKSLNTELSALSKSVTDLDLYDAFLETHNFCYSTDCQLKTGNQSFSKQRQTYATHVAARTKALKDLNGAYAALRKDAENDDRAEAIKSFDKLGESINSYVGLLNISLIPEAAITPVKFAIGVIASEKQKQRLDAANSGLAIATTTLNEALQKEHDINETVFDYVSEKTKPFETILSQSGLISYQKILEPLAKSKSINLVEDSEEVIRNNYKLKRSVDAIAAARTSDQAKQLKKAYLKAAQALTKMSDAHAAYNKDSVTLDEIIRLSGEVETAADLIKNLIDGADETEAEAGT